MTNPWTVASIPRFFFTRSAILRRQPSPCSGVATMSAAGEKNFSSDAAHLETIFKQKKALRSVVKRDLKSMDPILRSQEDEAIQRIVMEAPWFKACKRLCAYISSSALREVDTTQIMSHFLGSHPEDLQMQKKLFVPRVEDRNRNMRMLHISSTDDLIANSMDILEPAPVDADGNEREDVALCYSVQIVDEGTIPLTPNDILVDALVSPSGVIPISPAALEIRH
ncbi:5-formyltetrahydrofolate cyclo-ligase, mitochondrial-like isoform X4 [Nicotiana tabacum]|uniref:5-formyltetrahydrofolate cyclo-ligase n=1 Tax=Nicotiana tabacum TaxID=4097 RepID=A0A1S4CEB6_TOBAC|nr:PREDICTED: 5-formyltetrahydrofolate cyclo-ligase, mitochondrial-like isoform X4 [Nicotiana tabacum]